jgi:hypothetical protein
MMAVEIMIARQLTYFARAEGPRPRCDLEAGMAKLLGARVAWANADNALQIHGGNGFALEYRISRVLCDARILNIFEGAAEIQARSSPAACWTPFPLSQPRDEQALIRPAVEGTLRVLKAAQAAGVGRVVLTSSTVAVLNEGKDTCRTKTTGATPR